MGVDHFEARLNHPSESLKHHFSPLPKVVLEPYRRQKISPMEITEWIDDHPEFVEANKNVIPEWLRQKASDIIHHENLAAHDEQQRRGSRTNPPQDQDITGSHIHQELARNLASFQQVLSLKEPELLLLEAQDAVSLTRPFSTARAFIEYYATRIDRILNHRESRDYPADSARPHDAFSVPCRFAVMYPQSEETCSYSHWHALIRGVHEKECKYNPRRTPDDAQVEDARVKLAATERAEARKLQKTQSHGHGS
jgi:hypothetical protein